MNPYLFMLLKVNRLLKVNKNISWSRLFSVFSVCLCQFNFFFFFFVLYSFRNNSDFFSEFIFFPLFPLLGGIRDFNQRRSWKTWCWDEINKTRDSKSQRSVRNNGMCKLTAGEKRGVEEWRILKTFQWFRIPSILEDVISFTIRVYKWQMLRRMHWTKSPLVRRSASPLTNPLTHNPKLAAIYKVDVWSCGPSF